MSDEVTRLLAAAKRAAPEVDEARRRRILRAVLDELDELIDDAPEDSGWPEPGDLSLLAIP